MISSTRHAWCLVYRVLLKALPPIPSIRSIRCIETWVWVYVVHYQVFILYWVQSLRPNSPKRPKRIKRLYFISFFSFLPVCTWSFDIWYLVHDMSWPAYYTRVFLQAYRFISKLSPLVKAFRSILCPSFGDVIALLYWCDSFHVFTLVDIHHWKNYRSTQQFLWKVLQTFAPEDMGARQCIAKGVIKSSCFCQLLLHILLCVLALVQNTWCVLYIMYVSC